MRRLQLAHEIEPAAIGQAQVADHKVEAVGLGHLDGGGDGGGGPHFVVERAQQARHYPRSVFVIFHQKDVQPATHHAHALLDASASCNSLA
jgi:hypothetical protein